MIHDVMKAKPSSPPHIPKNERNGQVCPIAFRFVPQLGFFQGHFWMEMEVATLVESWSNSFMWSSQIIVKKA